MTKYTQVLASSIPGFSLGPTSTVSDYPKALANTFVVININRDGSRGSRLLQPWAEFISGRNPTEMIVVNCVDELKGLVPSGQ